MEITVPDRLRIEFETLFSLQRKPVMEGWCTVEKAMVLADLIIKSRPALVVESGTFGGKSALAMALALRENGAGVLYTIDPWTVESALEGDIGEANKAWWTENVNLESIYRGFIQAVLDTDLSNQCRWIRAKSEIAARLFPDQTIGLVHSDSCHSEVVSLKEVDIWAKRIAKGGYWVFDDSDWPTQQKALAIIPTKGFDLVEDFKVYRVYRKRA